MNSTLLHAKIIIMNKLAKIISLIFYPAITGAILVYILFFQIIGFSFKSLFLATIYAGLITLAPFLILRFLVKSGRVSDKDITFKEERSIFFKTALPSYIAGFVFLLSIQPPKTLFLMGSGVMIFIVVYYLISPFYKISVHVGGLVFDIIALGLVINQSFYFLLPLSLLLAWSRYHLKKHTLTQSFWGAMVGGGIPLILAKLFL